MTSLRKKLEEIISHANSCECMKDHQYSADQIIQAITELIEEAVGEIENSFDVGEDLTKWEQVEHFRKHIKSNLLRGVRDEV